MKKSLFSKIMIWYIYWILFDWFPDISIGSSVGICNRNLGSSPLLLQVTTARICWMRKNFIRSERGQGEEAELCQAHGWDWLLPPSVADQQTFSLAGKIPGLELGHLSKHFEILHAFIYFYFPLYYTVKAS